MSGPVRPLSFRDWCGTGATNVTQPANSQIDQGWGVGQKPPSSYENWFNQKVDRYLKYLEWRADLEVVVDENFCGDSVRQPIVSAATAFANWCKATGINIIRADVSYLDAALGIVTYAFAGGSGSSEWTTRIGRLRNRDFRMEFLVGDSAVRGHSGGSVGFGLFHTSGASGAFPRIGFVTTGASGTLGVQWQPSGAANPTSIALGIAMSPTSIHKLTLENRSPTMAIYYDATLYAAAPSPGECGASGVPMDFGLLAWTVSPTGFGGWLDRAYLAVGRNPA